MRKEAFMATISVIVAAMSGCTQDDQVLAIDLTDDQPVTRTVPASGEVTISTPAGVSVTLPEGTVSPGTQVTAQLVDPRQIAGLPPEAAGDKAFLIRFDEPPKNAPTVTFRNTIDGPVTLGQVLGAVPIAVPVSGDPASPSGGVVAPAWSVAPVAGAPNPFFNASYYLLNNPDLIAATTPPAAWSNYVNSQPIGGGGMPPGPSIPFSPTDYLDQLQDTVFDSGMTMQQHMDIIRATLQGGGTHPTCVENPQFCNFLVSTVVVGVTPIAPPVPLDILPKVTYPLIPTGKSSATFAMACTGLTWEHGVAKCDHASVDVRASQKVLDRFKNSAVAINYFAAFATLNADGTAEGLVQYDAALRVPMASGITGYAVSDSLDLDGRWSVDGNEISIGGHRFYYGTPDPDYVILAVSDSVKVKDNDGTESWEPVQAFLKLTRMSSN